MCKGSDDFTPLGLMEKMSNEACFHIFVTVSLGPELTFCHVWVRPGSTLISITPCFLCYQPDGHTTIAKLQINVVFLNVIITYKFNGRGYFASVRNSKRIHNAAFVCYHTMNTCVVFQVGHTCSAVHPGQIHLLDSVRHGKWHTPCTVVPILHDIAKKINAMIVGARDCLHLVIVNRVGVLTACPEQRVLSKMSQ